MTCFRVTHEEQLPSIINEQIDKLALQSHQLLILVGATTKQLAPLNNIPRLAISELLCEKLLPLANKRRVDEVEALLEELISTHKSGPVLLERIHLLFEPSLQLEVLRCLKAVSKQRTLIIDWPGAYNGAALSFSMPTKPDYFYYSETDLSSVPVLWLTGNGEQA
ncbi:BREX-3 system P-loop-containing protein BrxF [Shewanella baltica]|uniref:BREX-3 system P-loop-containing protein BrxF n=1 Tax=Shewanella baltica TaxID=62322 RepID=UPI00217E6407|nr:BREX-3 system P-loop-containing protein BrxF [Shewanella baltica]MCS6095700.1 BREX-3 system P-loop-containing protein BrxF [Shewanella baltica]MCS6226839.1 BREX-3 system P-loop-containing protein BrxF [Shewanella baltica]